jgi:quinolinate synthase
MDTTLSPEEQLISDRITELKQLLGDDLLILGHHYQRDSIVMHADFLGDSFMLSQKAADSSAKYIVFCGVHFMAESADILTDENQVVILPNLRAGCSMADMANLEDVTKCWNEILENSELMDPINRENPDLPCPENESYLIPVTYMNSSAALKSFVGQHGGIVCTSSNAQGILNWAIERAGKNGKVLFFPDQHLGRNTGLAMGLNIDEMSTWTPNEDLDELGWQQINDSKMILWHGFCSVHKRFTVEQIEEFRNENPNGIVIVHPECPRETVDASDSNGSTQFIRNFVEQQKPGAAIAIGTEINMVARLAMEHPDKKIECLDDKICPCSTMYMIHPAYLMDVLEKLVEGEIPNQISVPKDIQDGSLLALERMLSIKK